MAERSLKRRKSSKQPTNHFNRILWSRMEIGYLFYVVSSPLVPAWLAVCGKILDIGNKFGTVRDIYSKYFKSGMHNQLMKPFLGTSRLMTFWPWPWHLIKIAILDFFVFYLHSQYLYFVWTHSDLYNDWCKDILVCCSDFVDANTFWHVAAT